MIYNILYQLEKDYLVYKNIECNILSNKKTCHDIQYPKILKKYSLLKKKLHNYFSYKKIITDIDDLKKLNAEEIDINIKNLILIELTVLEKNKQDIIKCINESIISKTSSDDNENYKKIFIEIRSASGGNESAIFAEDLFKMYINYFYNIKWTYHIMSYNKGNVSGYKEIVLQVIGKNVFKFLKHESGIHRVQRIPITETNGKVHTSTCTIAILPEIKNVNEINININDIRVDTYRASGAGGQHVNMTDSAVRLTHIPTNIVVECQNERSQHKNKNSAMSLLTSKLLDRQKIKQKKILDNKRKNMVGSGDRSEKIRTYNYNKNRITDHRINLTLYRLKDVMNGKLNLIIDCLINV